MKYLKFELRLMHIRYNAMFQLIELDSRRYIEIIVINAHRIDLVPQLE
jgi:hypothetical protein